MTILDDESRGGGGKWGTEPEVILNMILKKEILERD